MIVNFLLRTLFCAETLFLYIFVHENLQKQDTLARLLTFSVHTAKKSPIFHRNIKNLYNIFNYLVQIFGRICSVKYKTASLDLDVFMIHSTLYVWILELNVNDFSSALFQFLYLLQVNFFQKVSFVYHFIREVLLYTAVYRLCRTICQIFQQYAEQKGPSQRLQNSDFSALKISIPLIQTRITKDQM